MNSRGKFWLLFGGLWLGVGLLFAAVGGIVLWLESEREARLAANGASASAVVLAKNITGGGQNRERTFGIEYRYVDATFPNAIIAPGASASSSDYEENSGLARFTRSPFTWTFPPATASAASARVL